MQNKRLDQNYLGRYVEKVKSFKGRRKNYNHPIFLYTADAKLNDELFQKLNQTVNVYKHSREDFIFNSLKIIDHLYKNYGDPKLSMFTLGQTIQFRVYPGQKEPDHLSLVKFLVNYILLMPAVLMGADLQKWVPWNPERFTANGWYNELNRIYRFCRHLGNHRILCEYTSDAKYLMNQIAYKLGPIVALSISNNEFIELMKRSDRAREIISCSKPLPKLPPHEMEQYNKENTAWLLKMAEEQKDLSISNYAMNKLFNSGQFGEFANKLGHKPDLYGYTIPYTSNTNIFMGLNDLVSYIVDAYGGRKAEIIKLNVSDAGALTRSLAMMMSSLRKVDVDDVTFCDSKVYRVRYIESLDILYKLDGRVATMVPGSKEYFIIDPYDQKIVDMIMGKVIFIKTPCTCTHPDRKNGTICAACYGVLMATLNCDIHIGRIASLDMTEGITQNLLSAKHQLITSTNEISFTPNFKDYFDNEYCRIFFNQDILDLSVSDPGVVDALQFEFYPSTIKKHQDGENRRFDKSIPEIVIYNAWTDDRIIINEEHGSEIYISPEFNEYLLDASRHSPDGSVIRVPFSDIIDTGKSVCDVLFEYQYKNNDLAGPLNMIESIMTKSSSMASFKTFNECLDTLIPLFTKGGINMPEMQIELILSQMIFTPDGKMVDWTEDDPKYQMFTIDKSIQNNSSVITSLLYQETTRQVAGAYRAYEKTGTSTYDYFIMDDKI